MTRTPRVTWLLLGSLFCLTLPASGAAADFKVGFVDRQRAVFSSTVGKEAEKTLSSLQEKKQSEVEPQQAKCKRSQEELEAQRFVLSEEALQERMIELRRCERELEREIQAARDEMAVEQQKQLAPIVKKFEESIKDLGKSNNFDLILDRSSPGVLYFQDGLDITDLVIKRLNQ